MDVQLIECGQHIDFDRVPPVGGILDISQLSNYVLL